MAVNATTNTQPVLLKDQVSSLLVQPLEAASVVLASGPRIFDSSNPIRIPKLVSSTNPNWVGEGELIPDHEVEFDELSLMPTDRKSIKALVRMTNELIRQSVGALDVVLKDRLVSDVASKLDDTLLGGTGTDKSVTGIINQAGTSKSPLDVTNPDSLLDALAVAASHEVTPNRWFLSGADFFSLRKIKDADGKYILQADLTADATYTLFGVPVTVTNRLTKGKGVLADMSQVAVVRDLDPTVTVLPERYAEFDETAIRVVTRYDLGLLNPEGIVVLNAPAK